MMEWRNEATTSSGEAAPQALFGWPGAVAGAPRARIEVLGVPSDCGNGASSGARFGPEAIRRASQGLRPEVTGVDRGDVEGVHGHDWADVLDRTEQEIGRIVEAGAVPIVLGGDHSISYAAVAALRCHPTLNIVWFDAHTDFCAWSGGRWHDHKQVLRRIAGMGHVGRILQVGHRGITYFDESARSDKMTVLSATAARSAPLESVLATLPEGEPVYISIDVDAIDPRLAPGTGHPVPGGVRGELIEQMARFIASRRRVVGLDVMEVNPLLDHRDTTSALAARLLAGIAPHLAPFPPSE
ncbi:arginase family protein [Corallococcus macrosporus]|uniref:Agmatinase n=1 Tax=Corallococcus macrosporus DSM 14697 TaxID=1189310 RepID=A0A250JXJ0_9BACT|nr:arginase family protein [Corallococcus macrosporus]ATB48340.1 agmatinase [Corallococcus macrosporus DSM 14697]